MSPRESGRQKCGARGVGDSFPDGQFSLRVFHLVSREFTPELSSSTLAPARRPRLVLLFLVPGADAQALRYHPPGGLADSTKYLRHKTNRDEYPTLHFFFFLWVICRSILNNWSGSRPAQSPSAANDLVFARSSRASRKPKPPGISILAARDPITIARIRLAPTNRDHPVAR